jgi:8-oxo-dGTP diphosphatase
MLQVVAGIIRIDVYVLLCRRSAKSARFPLKWEFPGGKVEAGESPEQALHRELFEELGIRIRKAELCHRYTYHYQDEPEFELIFFRVLEYDNTVQNRLFDKTAWLRKNQLLSYDLLEGDRPLLEACDLFS